MIVKALGVDSAMSVSETCILDIIIAPVDRESQDKFLWFDKDPFCPSASFAALTHPAACRSPLQAGPRGSRVWRDPMLCCWRRMGAPETAMPMLRLLR